MDTPRRVPGARRLSVPVFHSVPRPSSLRTRSAITRRRRQPIPLPLSRAALQSLAPLNLDIPISSVIVPAHGAAEPQDQREETSLYLVVLNHLVDLEARLHTSSSAMELLHKLRDEVAAFFPSVEGSTQGASSSKPTDEYDFEYDFNLRAALDFPFDFPAFDLNLASELDLNLRARYAELSNLTLDEAKNKLVQLSTLSYDDAISRLGFSALGSKFEDAKNRIKQWADDTVPALPTLPNMPTMPALPIPDLPDLPLPDLHARLAELCAALPADVSSATNRLVSFMEGLIEDDADGDISWVDARWKGLSLGEGREKGKGKGKEGEVDTHKVALALSEGGRKLIRYCDLPEKWKNNEFVMKGYRFIPGYKWPSLVLSIFQMHNETVNIQTHLLPLLAVICALPLPWTELTQSWGADSLFPTFSTPLVPALSVPSFAAPSLPISFSLPQLPFTPFPPSPVDPLPKFMFLLAAAACLTCSTIWHTLAGCSDLWWLEAGARVDYVGIGWLISASVSGVMYYGFACQPGWMWAYISVTVVTGLAGSILPFQGWFNERRNKKWRIAFFLLCACSAMVPLAHLAWRHSPFYSNPLKFMILHTRYSNFCGVLYHPRLTRHHPLSNALTLDLHPCSLMLGPLVPSLVSYLTGLAFYATHFPECCFPGRFDWGGSHAVWHVFIVVGEFSSNLSLALVWNLAGTG